MLGAGAKTKNMKKGFNVLIITYAIIGVLGLTGWVKGVIKLCSCDFEPSYKAEVIYGIGSVTGLGAVIGWIDFGK